MPWRELAKKQASISSLLFCMRTVLSAKDKIDKKVFVQIYWAYDIAYDIAFCRRLKLITSLTQSTMHLLKVQFSKILYRQCELYCFE